MPDDNPLTNDHCQCLDRVLESAARTRKLLADCKECGLPMDEIEAENETQAQLAARLKAKWFPNRG